MSDETEEDSAQDVIMTTTDFRVELVESMGSDSRICEAARVSTLGSEAAGTEESQGLINFLMKNRHGSPFEHGSMTFRIEAPIFVWREFMRHRIGFSYNEQSGRYMEMLPVFYVPPLIRPLRQVGKAGEYVLSYGDHPKLDSNLARDILESSYDVAWAAYQSLLAAGIAKEVARISLPLATYSSAYVTCNPRSLMSFLSLRTRNPNSHFPSYPQWEIERVASLMEKLFAEIYPMTWRAFRDFGSVSP